MHSAVVSRTLAVTATAEQVFHTVLADEDVAIWTDSRGDRGTGISILATGELRDIHGPPWQELRELWSGARGPDSSLSPLGIMVVVPYDALQYSMNIALSGPVEPVRVVDVRQALEVDEATGSVTAWAWESPEATAWMDSVEHALATPVIPPVPDEPAAVEATWREDTTAYRNLISQAKEAIRQGEVYQLCLTTSVSVPCARADWEVHQLLRTSHPTHHQALLRLGDVSVVSASPETFLTLEPTGRAVTRPIKGTRPRGQSEREDRLLVDQLVQSEKERAENLMIVDLMRNDFLRVCDTGSVAVEGLFEVETYSSVHQLVSTVTGVLAAGRDGVDLIEACFPAGSMTGAPKHRAVELLNAMEHGQRGVYSGAWGWLGADGSLELAMTIRSAVLTNDVAHVGVGGGITWSSEPDEEIAEVGHKARKLLGVLGVSTIQYS